MNLEVVIGVVNGYDAMCNMQYNLLIHIKIKIINFLFWNNVFF